MPVTSDRCHESAPMGPCVGVLDAVAVEMARDARGISTLGVVARSAAFNVAARKLGMQPAARTESQSHKVCLLMCQRSELRLIDVASGHVAGGAKFPR